jgi:hypothetical protein
MDLQLSRDGNTLTAAASNLVTLLGSRDLTPSLMVSNTPYISDTGPGVIRMPERMHFREEGGAALHPDGRTLLAVKGPNCVAPLTFVLDIIFRQGASDLWVREFDVATGEELRCLKGHHGPVRATHPTQRRFPFVSLCAHQFSSSQVRCAAYSTDGSFFATGSEDGTIRIWHNSKDEESTPKET